MPREVVEVDHLPLLGTGKTDYAAVTRLAEQRLAAAAAEAPPEPALAPVQGY